MSASRYMKDNTSIAERERETYSCKDCGTDKTIGHLKVDSAIEGEVMEI